MTRKDYVMLARAISISAKFNFDTCQEPRDAWGEKAPFMIRNIADALAQDNPYFQRERFLIACGVVA